MTVFISTIFILKKIIYFQAAYTSLDTTCTILRFISYKLW